MTNNDWIGVVLGVIGAIVGVGGLLIAYLSYKDSHKKIERAKKIIRRSYGNQRLHLLLQNLEKLDASETVELIGKLKTIMREGNGEKKYAELLLEYLRAKHDLD